MNSFWLYMLICDLLIPAVMLIFGIRFVKNPPKKINSFFGYRTSRSVRNQETWFYAHRYLGKLWKLLAPMLVVLAIVPMALTYGKTNDEISAVGLIVCFVQLALLLFSLVPVERYLERTFDENGRRMKP